MTHFQPSKDTQDQVKTPKLIQKDTNTEWKKHITNETKRNKDPNKDTVKK